MKIIGIDAGGTKTSMKLFSWAGQPLDHITLESCHPLRKGVAAMGRILLEGVHLLEERNHLKEKEAILSFGLAGYGKEPTLRQAMEEVLANIFQGYDYKIHNDGEVAHAGAFVSGEGILLIAGTGSIALGSGEEGLLRAGGFGPSFGDEGSAFWLAKTLLQRLTHMEDGRRRKTLLYGLVLQRLHLRDAYGLLGYVEETLGNQRENIASLAVLLKEACDLGDAEALEIYEKGAQHLAALIKALTARGVGAKDVAYYGGVFQGGDYVLKPLKKALGPDYRVVPPVEGPEYGAYLLAKRKFAPSMESR